MITTSWNPQPESPRPHTSRMMVVLRSPRLGTPILASIPYAPPPHALPGHFLTGRDQIVLAMDIFRARAPTLASQLRIPHQEVHSNPSFRGAMLPNRRKDGNVGKDT